MRLQNNGRLLYGVYIFADTTSLPFIVYTFQTKFAVFLEIIHQLRILYDISTHWQRDIAMENF